MRKIIIFLNNLLIFIFNYLLNYLNKNNINKNNLNKNILNKNNLNK